MVKTMMVFTRVYERWGGRKAVYHLWLLYHIEAENKEESLLTRRKDQELLLADLQVIFDQERIAWVCHRFS